MGMAIGEAMPLKGLNHEPGKKRHHYATKERSRQAIATGDRDAEQEQRPKQQMLPRQHAEQIGDHVGTQVAGIVENAEYATKIMGATRPDRKSTRLNSVTNAQLVCRLLLEK